MKGIRAHKNWYVEFDDPMLLIEYERISLFRTSAKVIAKKLKALLDSNPSETKVQEFFEQYPRCLPDGGMYHHGIRGDVVVAKLPLSNDFVTDFAYMSENSQEVCVFCVEIERPGKKLFRKDGLFSAEYLQAKQQVVDWNFWAQNHIREVLPLFGRLGAYLKADFYSISVRCILIMGRRSELTTRKRKERWAAEAALLPRTISVMTYDRLLESLDHPMWVPDNNKFVVCAYRDRALKVKSIGY